MRIEDGANVSGRPPIGFVVEGHGERNAYRTLVSRGLAIDSRHLPVVNANGVGSILVRLEELLDLLVKPSHPVHVIVSIDKRDLLRQRSFSSCYELRMHFQSRADAWLQEARGRADLNPVPGTVTVIVQDPMFEAWLIADGIGLVSAQEIVNLSEAPIWRDVDSEVSNPASWLEPHLKPGFNVKNPTVAKIIANHIDPSRAAAQSRSFRKFWQEIIRCYRNWADLCGWQL